MISQLCNRVFLQSVEDYHMKDDINNNISNPFKADTLEHLLYKKNWIDTVQWHLEDLIREPGINPENALQIKRRIDASNQERTDMVEFIDSYFFKKYAGVKIQPGAKLNTESPAWAIDRLSILVLKIYHMQLETKRTDASEQHRNACIKKLEILLEQQRDLSLAIDNLLEEIEQGLKYMKVYRQMKMYNDPTLNPVLYIQKK